jgi:hypothetical protein
MNYNTYDLIVIKSQLNELRIVNVRDAANPSLSSINFLYKNSNY